MQAWQLLTGLKLVNCDIEQVDSQKLLGVTIDKHLSFDVHVEELCVKLLWSHRIAVLRKIRRFIPIEQRILYYNAMIKQVMLYGSSIWSNCSADNLTRILKLQKRAARVILGVDNNQRRSNIYCKIRVCMQRTPKLREQQLEKALGSFHKKKRMKSKRTPQPNKLVQWIVMFLEFDSHL